jgi:hypothetical protein
LCFHSHSRLKNPEHLKFLCVSSVHHIWRRTKGPAITWGQYRLGKTGKGCLGMWLWASSTPVESISMSEHPPQPSYGGTHRPTFSLCLVKEDFSLGKLRKSSESITAVRQAVWGNSDARQGIIPNCQCYVSGAWLQYTKAFFFFTLLKHSLFQDLTHLIGGQKTACGKESLSSSQKRCSGWSTPRCHPKAGDATSWPTLRLQRQLSLGPLQPCPQQMDNHIS